MTSRAAAKHQTNALQLWQQQIKCLWHAMHPGCIAGDVIPSAAAAGAGTWWQAGTAAWAARGPGPWGHQWQMDVAAMSGNRRQALSIAFTPTPCLSSCVHTRGLQGREPLQPRRQPLTASQDHAGCCCCTIHAPMCVPMCKLPMLHRSNSVCIFSAHSRHALLRTTARSLHPPHTAQHSQSSTPPAPLLLCQQPHTGGSSCTAQRLHCTAEDTSLTCWLPTCLAPAPHPSPPALGRLSTQQHLCSTQPLLKTTRSLDWAHSPLYAHIHAPTPLTQLHQRPPTQPCPT